MRSKYPNPAQVWQRVHPPEPREQETVQMLVRQLQLDLAFLKQGPKGNSLREQLVREYTDQLLSLKGILQLTGGRMPREGGGLPDHSLRRCYDHTLQRLGAFQLRSSDPVYGPVFRDLSQQTERHCRYITELIGSKSKDGP